MTSCPLGTSRAPGWNSTVRVALDVSRVFLVRHTQAREKERNDDQQPKATTDARKNGFL
ncbi:hypothetical protein [Ktedonobacter sp. SOSP1-52]|uniref:hypothetical protein n=1 Tax=Ktedonobacter sp. SOSP1-52 TaxID=2778366 RepID=UPI00191609EC|nr:hypothetical protein [Ktedonobacter sp. SOSP1-52]